MTGKLSRRSFFGVAGLAGAGAALAACGGTAAPAAEPQAGATAAPAAAAGSATVLEVWNNNWGEVYNEPMKAVGEAYTAETGIKVNWAFNDQWQEKLLTAVAGGIPPDACYTNWVGLPTLAHQGTLLPLDDYFAASGIQASDFIKAMVDACVWEGKTYGIPGGADFLVLHYSKDVYEAAGLDPEQPPVTLDDWVAHSEAIYKFDSAGNIERMGMGPTEPGLIYAAFLFDGDFYNTDEKRVTCNEGGTVAALEWMVENSKRWPVEKVAAFTAGMPGYSQPNSGFATGKVTYMYNGYWSAEALDKYAPDLNYGLAFLPTLNGTPEERKNYVIQGWDYSVPAGAKNPDAGWAFLKYSFYDNAADLSVKTINGNCVLDQMDEYVKGVQEWLGPNNRMTPQFSVFSDTGAAGEKFWPVMPVASRYHDEVNRAQDFATRGEMTAQEALDEAARVTQEELDAALKA